MKIKGPKQQKSCAMTNPCKAAERNSDAHHYFWDASDFTLVNGALALRLEKFSIMITRSGDTALHVVSDALVTATGWTPGSTTCKFGNFFCETVLTEFQVDIALLADDGSDLGSFKFGVAVVSGDSRVQRLKEFDVPVAKGVFERIAKCKRSVAEQNWVEC